MAEKSRHHIGIGLGLGAAVSFGLCHSIIVLAYSGGTNPISVSATRFVLPILVLLAFLVIRRDRIALPRAHAIRAIGLGVVTAGYTLALLMALDRVPAGIAMLVFYLFPIFTGVIVALMGWTRFDRKTAGASIVALLGLALTLGVRPEDYDLVGLALSALGALGLAVVSAASVRVIAVSGPLRTTLYMSVGAQVTLVAVVAALGGFQWPGTQEGWTAFILSHVFYAASLIAYFVALARVGAATAATLGYLQPLIVIAVAYLLLGQSLTPLQLAGAVIVVGALVVAARKGPVAAEASQ